MNKQSSHQHFSFKPKKHSNSNTSFSTCQTIEYDTIISNILSEASLPKHVLSSKQITTKTINLESNLSSHSIQSLDSNSKNFKPSLSISPLTHNDSHSHIKNIKVVSYIKQKQITQSAKTTKTIPFFTNKTTQSKQRLNIPKPKMPHKTKKQDKSQKMININVNVFIQSSSSSLKGINKNKSPMTSNKSSMSSLSIYTPRQDNNNKKKKKNKDNNEKALLENRTLRRQCMNLSNERLKRSLSKVKKEDEEEFVDKLEHKLNTMHDTNSLRSNYSSSTINIHKIENVKIINKLRTKKRLVLQRANELLSSCIHHDLL